MRRGDARGGWEGARMRTSSMASTLVAAMASGAALVLSSASASADTSWLDKKPLPSWNVAGAAIPHAPKATEGNLARCGSTLRRAQTPTDRQVAAAGWKLFGPYQLYDGTALVFAESDADGMCRPQGYQGFIFVDGRFAGTLAPSPMDDRIDGAVAVPRLFEAGAVTGEYSRYSASDPLCCPSRTTSVDFKLQHRQAGAVFVPTGASTTKNSS
jgi:hypothetical protein